MKQWLNKLSIYYKTAFLSLIAVIIAFLGLLFEYFINQPDLPNGLIAGGMLGVVSYFFLGVVDRIDEQREKPIWSIVITIVRYLLIAALVTVAALLQYKYSIKVMNPFMVVGGYFISLIFYIIVALKERKHV